jgi:hypothetical protein
MEPNIDIMAPYEKAKIELSGGSRKGILSPAEQLARYKRISDRAGEWSKAALNRQDLHPSHRQVLEIISKHGLKGLAEYVQAMEKLQGSPGTQPTGPGSQPAGTF